MLVKSWMSLYFRIADLFLNLKFNLKFQCCLAIFVNFNWFTNYSGS
jgi:hypothetical protein